MCIRKLKSFIKAQKVTQSVFFIQIWILLVNTFYYTPITIPYNIASLVHVGIPKGKQSALIITEINS